MMIKKRENRQITKSSNDSIEKSLHIDENFPSTVTYFSLLAYATEP